MRRGQNQELTKKSGGSDRYSGNSLLDLDFKIIFLLNRINILVLKFSIPSYFSHSFLLSCRKIIEGGAAIQ